MFGKQVEFLKVAHRARADVPAFLPSLCQPNPALDFDPNLELRPAEINLISAARNRLSIVLFPFGQWPKTLEMEFNRSFKIVLSFNQKGERVSAHTQDSNGCYRVKYYP